MVQGVGARASSPCCNYLSASFIGPIVFSQPLMRRGAEVGEGAVVKTQNQPAGDLFANSETNCHLNGITEELNKVKQENELRLFYC